MSESYSKGAQTAQGLGDDFVIGNLAAGSAAFAGNAVTDTFTPLSSDDGLFFYADWVQVAGSIVANGFLTVTGISTSTGVVTVTRSTSTGADTYYWLAGNLA